MGFIKVFFAENSVSNAQLGMSLLTCSLMSLAHSNWVEKLNDSCLDGFFYQPGRDTAQNQTESTASRVSLIHYSHGNLAKLLIFTTYVFVNSSEKKPDTIEAACTCFEWQM